MTFYDRLMELMYEQKLRQTDLTRDLGFKPGHFQTWRKGSKPRKDNLKQLADYFGVSEAYLLGYTDDKNETEGDLPITYDIMKTRAIPLFSSIPDSDNIFEESKYIDDTIPCSTNLKSTKDLFALIATNNTMSPIINVGDIIIAKLSETYENGDLCIYQMYGNIGIRWIDSNDSEIILEPEFAFDSTTNKGYKNIVIPLDNTSDFDFKIIGTVVEVRKVLRNLHKSKSNNERRS